MNIVETRDLSVRYGTYEALSAVTQDVAPGDFLAVVGPNGSGKSTFIKAILGLVEPQSGLVLIKGLPPSRATVEFPVGYLPQKAFFTDPRFPATVREVVASGFRGRRLEHGAVDRALALLRVESLAAKRIGTLSGGQQQRAHLARALVNSPDLLILDEPTGALDPESRECFYETLADLNEGGITIIIVSHDLDAVSRAARTVLFLDRVTVYSGTIEGFNAREPKHYFGSGHHHGACHADD